MMTGRKLPHFRRRILLMLLGVVGNGFFLSFLVELQLGVGPIDTLCLGLAGLLGLSHGTLYLSLNAILFLLQLWRGRRYIGLGTVANMALVGYISDFFRFLWRVTLPEGFFLLPPVRFTVLLPALLGFIVFVGFYIAADIGVAPYDAVPGILHEAFPRIPYMAIRLSLDVAVLIGAFFTGTHIGVVTALLAFGIAPILSAVRGVIERKVFRTSPEKESP